jgi:hypothetical protein
VTTERRQRAAARDELEVVGGDVATTGSADPPETLLALADEPVIDMERHVPGNGGVHVGDLGDGHGPSGRVKDEMDDVEQIGALLVDRAVHDRLRLHRNQRSRLCNEGGDLDAVTIRTEHLDRQIGGGVVRPGVSRCVEAIARVVARLIELDLTDLENVDLDLSVRRREQHRSRLHRLRTIGCPEDSELRYVSEQAVDDVEVDCGAVRTGQPGQYGEAADDYRWSTDEAAYLDDPLNDSGHGVAQEGDAATRHGPTAHRASKR